MSDMPDEIWVHHSWINEQGHGTCCISDYACALDTRYIRADIAQQERRRVVELCRIIEDALADPLNAKEILEQVDA